MDSISGKVIIITGASTGIGAAAARLLVHNGCKVVLAARSADKLEALASELGEAALSVPGDVTIEADVERLVQQAIDRFGKIDVLLANAGIYIPGQIAEGNPNDWARLIDVNIVGVMRCVHAVLPHLMAQKSGDILVTSSISGFSDIHWEPVYSASKHAIQSFVHTVRRQMIPYNIRVGSIAPGTVANELWGISTEEEIRKRVDNHSCLRSEDVAEAILFMLSQPAHVTIRDLVMLPQGFDL
ncbi:MAG: SDR family oxidoreductase [Anaerolineaceae bacterium]|nr:SDR family oxidoreductase [Anaerolineaceae bacterium]